MSAEHTPGPWFSFDDEVAVTRDQAAAIRSAGFKVVLAHPERSLTVQRQPELLFEFVEQGTLVCFLNVQQQVVGGL